jgi:hypothetical protein
MRDVILSHLHRNDLTQVNCVRHGPRFQEGSALRPDAYTIKLKQGSRSVLPRLLELDNGDAGFNFADAAAVFTLDNGLIERVILNDTTEYRLIAMTYYDQQHYVASVLLAGEWYMYNDLGHKSPLDDGPRSEAHLLKCDFQTAATPPTGFYPRSYVLARTRGIQGAQTNLDWTPFDPPMFGNLAMLAASDTEDDADVSPEI